MSVAQVILKAMSETTTSLGSVMAKTGDGLVDAIKNGNTQEFLAKNGPDLLNDPGFMRVMGKIGNNLDELEGLERGLRSGAANSDSILQKLGIDASDDLGQRLSGLEHVATQSFKTTDGLMEGLSREGAEAQMKAQQRRAAREAAEQASKDAAEQASQEAAEKLAQEAAEKLAQEAAEKAAAESAEALAKQTAAEAGTKTGANVAEDAAVEAGKKSNWKRNTVIGGVAGIAMLRGDQAQNPDAKGDAGDGPAIPLHLMTDEEFREYSQHQAIHDPNYDMGELIGQRMQAQADAGLGEVDAAGGFALNQEKILAARKLYNKETPAADNGAVEKALALKEAEDAAEAAKPEGIMGFFQEIMEMIQGFIKMLGGGGGMFGNLSFGNKAHAASNPNSNANTTNTPQNTPAPTPQAQPKLSPEQQAENALLSRHSGYGQNTIAAIQSGAISADTLDLASVNWDKDEIITGNADYERILEDNIANKFDGGTGGVLHVDENEGLVYISKDANGDVQAHIVNDHINDIPNLNSLPLSSYSVDGFAGALQANDRQTPGFNAGTGIVKTVEFEDGFFDGKDIKNETLQFHAQVGSNGVYNLSVINDDYRSKNGPVLEGAKGQTHAMIGRDEPGFDYYAHGKDPVQEKLLQDQQTAQTGKDIGNAVGTAITNVGDAILRNW